MHFSSGQLKYYCSKDYLLSMRDYCFKNNIDFMGGLAQADLPTELILSPPDYIPLNVYSDICLNIAQLASWQESPIRGMTDFASLQASKNSHGILGLSIRNAENVLQALELFEEYSLTRSNFMYWSLQKDEKYIYCIVKENNNCLTDIDPILAQFVMLTSMLNPIFFIRQSINHESAPFNAQIFLEGSIKHLDLAELDEHIHIQGDYSVNALRIPLEVGESEILLANTSYLSELLPLLKKQLQLSPHNSVMEDVKYLIHSHPWHNTSIEEIASKLNFSVSTLQRRLREEGTNFKELKNQERIENAEHYLLFSNKTLDYIAHELGFNNSSNFSKSFKLATGISPKDFRHRHQTQR